MCGGKGGAVRFFGIDRSFMSRRSSAWRNGREPVMGATGINRPKKPVKPRLDPGPRVKHTSLAPGTTARAGQDWGGRDAALGIGGGGIRVGGGLLRRSSF